MKKRYETTTAASAHNFTFKQVRQSSHIKSIREDFNDMFAAEAKTRRLAGDKSLVFVLTYNNSHLCHKYGQNLLNSENLQILSKSSQFCKVLSRAFGYEFDFVSVGEYGEGGESHNYKGKRGKGQNPHYHCVGWFHKIGEINVKKVLAYFLKINFPTRTPRPLADYAQCDAGGNLYLGTEFETYLQVDIDYILHLLVRYVWQGTYTEDPKTYALQDDLSRGFGYVCLDGEIASDSAGSFYISKYIGKDIQKVFSKAYLQGFCKYLWDAFEEVFKDHFIYYQGFQNCIIQKFIQETQVTEKYLLQNYFEHKCKDVVSFKDLFEVAKIGNQELDNVLDDLNIAYNDYYEKFYEGMTTIHSPKVRKFHGFGYSLCDNANLERGTYSLVKPSKVVTRLLPPSLIRHLYYNHLVCINEEGEKVVKYIPNQAGITYIANKMNNIYKKDENICSALGSDNLKTHWMAASIFDAYLSRYDILEDSYSSAEFFKCLKFPSAALSYALNCVPTHLTDEIVINGKTRFLLKKDTRSFYDLHHILECTLPNVYEAYKELCSLKETLFQKKDAKDEEYLNHWIKCYNFNY